MSISSSHPNAYPTALFTSAKRRAGNFEMRSNNDCRATVLRLSQFATQGLGRPSRLRGRTGRRSAVLGSSAHQISNCLKLRIPGNWTNRRRRRPSRVVFGNFANSGVLLSADRLFDRLPEELRPAPFRRGSDLVQGFIGGVVKLDENRAHAMIVPSPYMTSIYMDHRPSRMLTPQS
jgi:hypothetical protein